MKTSPLETFLELVQLIDRAIDTDKDVGLISVELQQCENLRSALQRSRQEIIDLQMKLAQYELADDVEFTDEEVWLTAWSDIVRSGRALQVSATEHADDTLREFKKRFRSES